MTTTPTRRAVLAGAAAAPALAVPAIATEPDPIFAAIEAHKAAVAAVVAAIAAADHKPGSEHDEHVRELAIEVAGDHADDLAIQLVDVEPTTIAGVIAVLDYAADYADRGDGWPALEDNCSWTEVLCGNVAVALRRMSSARQGLSRVSLMAS